MKGKKAGTLEGARNPKEEDENNEPLRALCLHSNV
jgi:hypothetical protein